MYSLVKWLVTQDTALVLHRCDWSLISLIVELQNVSGSKKHAPDYHLDKD